MRGAKSILLPVLAVLVITVALVDIAFSSPVSDDTFVSGSGVSVLIFDPIGSPDFAFEAFARGDDQSKITIESLRDGFDEGEDQAVQITKRDHVLLISLFPESSSPGPSPDSTSSPDELTTGSQRIQIASLGIGACLIALVSMRFGRTVQLMLVLAVVALGVYAVTERTARVVLYLPDTVELVCYDEQCYCNPHNPNPCWGLGTCTGTASVNDANNICECEDGADCSSIDPPPGYQPPNPSPSTTPAPTSASPSTTPAPSSTSPSPTQAPSTTPAPSSPPPTASPQTPPTPTPTSAAPSPVTPSPTVTPAPTTTPAPTPIPAPVPSPSPPSPSVPPPESLVGFGSSVTGGRSADAEVVVVTSLSDNTSSGSIRWALNQSPGTPLYIVMAVEGEIPLRSHLVLDRPDVTIDFRFAPGNGVWFTGDRIEVEADNIFLESVRHFGNDPTPDGTSDCLRWGLYSTDTSASDHVVGGYCRRCEFYHGQDEVLATTPRGNGQSGGNEVRDVTWEKTIVANPTGAEHEFGVFVGDGTDGLTIYQCLFSNFKARYPFTRQYATKIEMINSAIYNFNENAIEIVNNAQVNIIGLLARLGPRWNNIRSVVSLGSNARTYVEDILYDSPGLGKVNDYGDTRGNSSPLGSPSFSTSTNLDITPSTEVAATVVAEAGARLYGGVYGDYRNTVVAGFNAGDEPTAIASHPGPTPVVSGASYPGEGNNGIPPAYQTLYPDDTNLADIINDGSAWDGYLVAERVGAFLVSDLNA